MFKLVVFFALLQFALAVAVPKRVPVSAIKNIHPKIVNGQEAVPHSIPYQVWLWVEGNDRQWSCGGALISSKYVLTAGQCVVGGNFATVTLGAHNIDEKEPEQLKLRSKRLILHENFDAATFKFDIGLIELETEVKETDAIKIGALSSDSANTFEGETGKMSGWGQTHGSDIYISSVLMFEEDTIISNEECHKYFGGLSTDGNICLSGKSDHMPCNGDSGDPLTVDGMIVGVFSFMQVGCITGYPSGFSRISFFLQWILDNSDVTVV